MKIKSITKVKPRTVYAIETTSGTYIADGLYHHNCKSCNIWGRGRLDLYAKYMYDNYEKEVVDGLIANKWSLVRFKESDLNRIGDKYKKKYKELVEKYGEPE